FSGGVFPNQRGMEIFNSDFFRNGNSWNETWRRFSDSEMVGIFCGRVFPIRKNLAQFAADFFCNGKTSPFDEFWLFEGESGQKRPKVVFFDLPAPEIRLFDLSRAKPHPTRDRPISGKLGYPRPHPKPTLVGV